MEHSKAKRDSNATALNSGYVLISGDYDGDIKVFANVPKPKHSSLPSPTISNWSANVLEPLRFIVMTDAVMMMTKNYDDPSALNEFDATSPPLIFLSVFLILVETQPWSNIGIT